MKCSHKEAGGRGCKLEIADASENIGYIVHHVFSQNMLSSVSKPEIGWARSAPGRLLRHHSWNQHWWTHYLHDFVPKRRGLKPTFVHSPRSRAVLPKARKQDLPSGQVCITRSKLLINFFQQRQDSDSFVSTGDEC